MVFLAAFRLLRLSRLCGFLPKAGQPKTGSDSLHKSEHVETDWGRMATPETFTAGSAAALGSGMSGSSPSTKSFRASSRSSGDKCSGTSSEISSPLKIKPWASKSLSAASTSLVSLTTGAFFSLSASFSLSTSFAKRSLQASVWMREWPVQPLHPGVSFHLRMRVYSDVNGATFGTWGRG